MHFPTGKFPRSMSEINPYMSGPIEPMPEPACRKWQDLTLYCISFIVAVILATMHFIAIF